MTTKDGDTAREAAWQAMAEHHVAVKRMETRIAELEVEVERLRSAPAGPLDPQAPAAGGLVMPACPRCNGGGTTETHCTDPQHGDSTWDHACDDGYEDCALCDGSGYAPAQLRCGHPVECYRRHGAHGSSCGWCVDVISLGLTLDRERTAVVELRDQFQRRHDELADALRDIAGRWPDDTEHSRSHDPETCEVVICVAKRALA